MGSLSPKEKTTALACGILCFRDSTVNAKPDRTFNPADYMESSATDDFGTKSGIWETGQNDADDGTVIEEPTRRGAILDLVLANKKGLVGNVKFKSRLGCSDHEMVAFENLRAAARRMHNKLTALDFRRADFGLFGDMLGRVSWDKALEGRSKRTG
ncbi:hypothetical protein DUI87_01041 [Hirundo rustica rustica]|uniref:Endonuclease/exonuclease/phosphatase domain-containing protein n=1 Tax=Hirundo rustica rustica TaxID=333673 RepID=A0A3M0L453_HIRRU|nr:hypothetical protein DUI87_01041 [Hirundo rustica rustica]